MSGDGTIRFEIGDSVITEFHSDSQKFIFYFLDGFKPINKAATS